MISLLVMYIVLSIYVLYRGVKVCIDSGEITLFDVMYILFATLLSPVSIFSMIEFSEVVLWKRK
jgi:hypothetical protein